MGVMSRQVLPVCASFCCCLCPGMRARSKKPIKRYNQFLGAIFKSAEEGEVNDKQAGKLAEYACENPDRIPVILEKLDERAVRDLPAGRYFGVASVTRAQAKLMVECREHMPLIAGPVLGLAQKLLNSKSPEMRCLGCLSATSFFSCQVDTSFGTQIDNLLLSILAVARESDSKNSTDPSLPGTKASSLAAVKSFIMFTSKFGRVLPQQSWDQILSAVLDAFPRQTAAGEGGESVSSQVDSARAEMQAALSAARSKGTKADPLSAHLPEVSKDLLQNSEVASLDCVWALANLVTQGSASMALFVSALRPILAYVSNGGFWSPGGTASLGYRILLDLRDALRVLGAQQGRERQTEFQLIHCMVALITDASDSPVPQQCQAEALTALSILLKDTQAGGERPMNSGATTPDEPPRKLVRLGTASSGFAVGEVLCAESLTKFTSKKLALEQLTESVESAVKECIGEFARLIGLKAEFLDALGVTVEGIPAAEVQSTKAALDAVRILLPAGMTRATVSGSDGSHNESRDLDNACPQLLFNVILQVLCHPDPAVQDAAHKLLQSLVEQQDRRIRVFLTLDQSMLLLSALWFSLAECSENLPPAGFLSANNMLKLALAPHGAALQMQASRLSLSIRHLAVTDDSIQPSARRSLLTLSSAIILWLLELKVKDGVLSLLREMLPKDPFLLCQEDGTLSECHSGDSQYASPEDRALATQELAMLGPKERRLQPQRKFAEALAGAIVGERGGNQEEVLHELLAEFTPDSSLAVLRSSYLSSNDLPPSASPSALMGTSAVNNKTVSVLGPAAGSFAEALDSVVSVKDTDADSQRQSGYARSASLPGLDDLMKSGNEAQSNTALSGAGDSTQNVDQALAILEGIA